MICNSSTGYLFCNTDSIIKKDQLLKTDFYQAGDIIKCCILKLNRECSYYFITVSGTNKHFVLKLFLLEVKELYNNKNNIIIKSIARKSGFKTKIAIHIQDSRIDAIDFFENN